LAPPLLVATLPMPEMLLPDTLPLRLLTALVVVVLNELARFEVAAPLLEAAAPMPDEVELPLLRAPELVVLVLLVVLVVRVLLSVLLLLLVLRLLLLSELSVLVLVVAVREL